MKKIIFTLLSLVFVIGVYAQPGVPQGINYQAMVYVPYETQQVGVNSSGQIPAKNQKVDVAFTITNGENGNAVYSETHSQVSTDEYGLLELTIGTGTTTNSFNAIDWKGIDAYLGVTITVEDLPNPITSKQKLWSVPYALYAEKSGNGITGVTDNGDGTLTFTYLDGGVYTTGPLTGLTGPAGAQGPAGPTGATGPEGPQGIQGPAGPAGADGAQGPQGPAGADGAQGPIGLTGPAGADGAPGSIGLTGPAGADGAQGPQGDQGPQGATGDTGATGPEGPQGPQGDQGPQGPAGADGAQGPQGDQGPQGATGDTGATGPEGPQGIQGPEGPQGPIGLTGATGPQGEQGPAGANGADGPQGPAGADGAQGPAGPTGATGPQGPAGTGGFTHYIGELFGGGIVIAVWKESGVEKGLIASLTDVSASAQYSSITGTLIGATAQSLIDGQANTTAIVAQGDNSGAAYLCANYSSGGFSDWYLPSIWELNLCYNAVLVVNTILGATNGFQVAYYWSSTELSAYNGWLQSFWHDGDRIYEWKDQTYRVRAVRRF